MFQYSGYETSAERGTTRVREHARHVAQPLPKRAKSWNATHVTHGLRGVILHERKTVYTVSQSVRQQARAQKHIHSTHRILTVEGCANLRFRHSSQVDQPFEQKDKVELKNACPARRVAERHAIRLVKSQSFAVARHGELCHIPNFTRLCSFTSLCQTSSS
jgi:hypothetical protein